MTTLLGVCEFGDSPTSLFDSKGHNSSVPVLDVRTMDERIDSSLATRSFVARLVAVFSAISVLLAALGIHGLIAQVVMERTAEIGIRMALGSRSGDILRSYLMQGIRLSLIGLAIGLGVAAGCRECLRSFLYQVQPIVPSTWMLGVLGVLVISVLAVLGPSWRASRVDPQSALRGE